MSLIKKILLIKFMLILSLNVCAQEVKKIGKFKDWETMILNDTNGRVCFAQAKSGKHKYKFDIAQQKFAWIADKKIEKKMIRTMKKGSRLMVSGYNSTGSQTIDHYSLLGFTKAYNKAKKSCG